MKKVGIIMGSDSDLPVVRKAIDTLASFDVPYEVHIYSAHRTPVQAQSFTASARDNGFGVLICAAGMAAHLAGAVAANTTLPVIGIPMSSSNLGGMEALLSTVQMPSGIPMPHCWPWRCWPSPTTPWLQSSPPSAPPIPRPFWQRTPLLRQSSISNVKLKMEN